MSKALNKVQTDLDALKAELEAWLSTAPPALPKPARKPAVKRTRAQLIAAATAALPAALVEPPQEVDTSWLDLLSPVPAAVVVAAPVEPPHVPEPTPTPAPLYVDATHLIRIDLTPEPVRVPVRTTPKRSPRTLRQAIRVGGYSTPHTPR